MDRRSGAKRFALEANPIQIDLVDRLEGADVLAGIPAYDEHIRAADSVRRNDPDVAKAWADRLDNRRRGCHIVSGRLKQWNRLAPGWSVRSAGDWLTAQASVKVWEELVMDLGWSRRRYVRFMSLAACRTLLRR